jgi:outer membrane protein
MQICVASLGAALLIAAAGPAGAQDVKIGFVNVPYLIRNAPQTQAIDERLRSEFAPRDAELQEMVEAFQAKVERYELNAEVISQSEAQALQRELQQDERDLQRRQTEMQEDFTIRQEELLGELQSTVGVQVQAWAEENDYDLIVANVVYVSDAIDVTEEVLAAISEDADE